jgi:hypothetical protein
MFKIPAKILAFFLLFTAALTSLAGASPSAAIDKSRYIGIDEIHPGMKGYCLTTLGRAGIEKFDLDVLSVVRNISPGRNAILVQGTDERFIHTGPVAGCSGSPVYIDGRMAGALAFGWPFSKDAVYGVTPIEEMLSITMDQKGVESAEAGGYTVDYTAPIDFSRLGGQIADGLPMRNTSQSSTPYLPFPLVIGGLTQEAREQVNSLVKPFGFMAVAGSSQSNNVSGEKLELVPGASLAVPLLSGDITMMVIGTVTERVGEKVYALGHGFLGYGQGHIDLPMATAEIHAVVSSLFFSFKVASVVEVVGALTTDESSGVGGYIGAKAGSIPLTRNVDRYNDPQRRVYNCQVASHPLLTPVLVRAAVAGASFMLGRLPVDNMVEYEVSIGLEGFEPITFANVSTKTGVNELANEIGAVLVLLMNNPYRKVTIKSLDFDIRIAARNILSHIWSVNLSDTTVKAGEQIDVSIIIESVLAGKKRYEYSLEIPEGLAEGNYNLIVSGGQGYKKLVAQAFPYRFVPQNISTLVQALKDALGIRRDKLYSVLVLPASGVALENAELPDLPATKALVLGDGKRSLNILPYQHWLEKTFQADTVVIDKKIIPITVER